MSSELRELLLAAADRGDTRNPDSVLRQAQRAASRRRRALQAAGVGVGGVLVAASALAMVLRGEDGRAERVTAASSEACASERGCGMDPGSSEASVVRLSAGTSVWPHDSSTANRDGPAVVASAFVSSVTGEDPVEVVERPSTAPGPAPTSVDVRLRSGATVDVFTAPDGDRGWRVLGAGQPTAQGPSGAIQADVSVGPVEVGDATSGVQVKFNTPDGSVNGVAYYSTAEGTFLVALDAQALRTQRVLLPKARMVAVSGVELGGASRRNPTGVGAVVLVFRGDDGNALFIRGVHLG